MRSFARGRLHVITDFGIAAQPTAKS